ncbi:MAG TPA: polysaccharide pyruvyl transferase family protein, partial [Bryobacteraceae bacterium]
MRILIDPGTYNCLNLGDLAMLQVAVRRLRLMAPGATIQVITDTPAALARHCPDTEPLSGAALRLWFDDAIVLPRGQRFVLPVLLDVLRRIKTAFRSRSPRLLGTFFRLTMPRSQRRDFEAFIRAIYSADAVVICGKGFLTDHVRDQAMVTLNLVCTAVGRKIPCAMFGQGIGPLSDETVLSVCRELLLKVDLLSLREGIVGAPLLESMCVPRTRYCVSGDEAIELAYTPSDTAAGTGLGLNVRIAPSAGVDGNFLEILRPLLAQFICDRPIPLIPLPIARDHQLRDVRNTGSLIQALGSPSDGGRHLETTRSLIEETKRCRIVLTGAYHAAVFALAQGIPAICLAKSSYFQAKFNGLASQFGKGCVVISLEDPMFERRLLETLR